MAQDVKLINELLPSDKEGWDTIAADISCEHALDIDQEQHKVDVINQTIWRAQAQGAESGLMQRVSMVRFECNDWAELLRL